LQRSLYSEACLGRLASALQLFGAWLRLQSQPTVVVTAAVIDAYLVDYLQNIFDRAAALSLATHTVSAVQSSPARPRGPALQLPPLLPPAPTALARSHRPRHARHRLSSHRSSRQRHRASPTSSSAHRRPTPTAGPPADLGCGPSSRPSSAPSRASTYMNTVGGWSLGSPKVRP